jgi:hypothetical protein
MKLLARVVRRFYSVEVKTSEQQLLDDFGEFPPTPLRCESLRGEFKVVRTHGIGEIYQDFVLQKALFNSLDSDPQSISTEAKNFLGGAEFMLKFRDALDYFSGGSAFGKRVLISMTLGFQFLKKTTRAIWFGPTRPDVLGAFIPLHKDEAQIFIKAGRHRKRQKSDASTVSHEHLHLLQHRNPEDHSRHVKAPQDFLTEKGLSDAYILYFLEKKEVEARLHECVLSFYRAHRQLPLTTSGFLGLLASSRECGLNYALRLKLMGVTVVEFGEYSERDVMWAAQLTFILHNFKTNELAYRFITEVLTVMYGNLLKYYGDPVASKSYLEAISRPNLYDEMY